MRIEHIGDSRTVTTRLIRCFRIANSCGRSFLFYTTFLTLSISEYLKHRFVVVGQSYGINLQEWNHDIDHVHVLFRATPHTEMAKFLNAYKSSSSRMVKKLFPEIKRQLWKSAFWTQSYCLISTGGAPLEVVKKYIESQGRK